MEIVIIILLIYLHPDHPRVRSLNENQVMLFHKNSWNIRDDSYSIKWINLHLYIIVVIDKIDCLNQLSSVFPFHPVVSKLTETWIRSNVSCNVNLSHRSICHTYSQLIFARTAYSLKTHQLCQLKYVTDNDDRDCIWWLKLCRNTYRYS